MKTKLNPRAFTAKHESAHRVYEWISHQICGKISIQSRQDYEGICSSYLSTDSESFENNTLTPQRVYRLMAGRAAIEAYFPDLDQAGTYRSDFEAIKNLKSDDETMLAMHQWRSDHPDGDVEDFYHAFKQPVIAMFKSKQCKRAFNALCKALLKAGHLSGRESVRILEEAWGHPLPPLAIPSEHHPSLDNHVPAKNFNDFLHQMAVFERIFRIDVTEWVNNDANTPEQDKIVEQLSGAFNFIKILVNK